MVEKPAIKWSQKASKDLYGYYKFIQKESPKNATKVLLKIIRIVDELSNHPKRFPEDKYKTLNKGDYRAFDKYSLRITYKIEESQIIIIRCRHIKQSPKSF